VGRVHADRHAAQDMIKSFETELTRGDRSDHFLV
jgi:hypothetical protein